MISNKSYKGMDALYVHIPFCVAKCHYCDFVSYAVGGNSDIAESSKINSYLTALLHEADIYKGTASLDDAIKSLYLGGGTPTSLTARQLFWLLDSLQRIFVFSQDAEI